MNLRDLILTEVATGKGAVFQANKWDFDSNLWTGLTHLGFTEGEISVNFNETFNTLTTPEYTGDAPRKRTVQGEAPVATVPLYLARPELRADVSPTGGASGGRVRQQPVVQKTLVIIPEELFLDLSDPEAQEVLELEPTGTGWTLGGVALTDEQERLLGQSIWFWAGHWTKPALMYRDEEGGKQLADCEFTSMFADEAPNAHKLYTIGDPYDAGIDILTGIVES